MTAFTEDRTSKNPALLTPEQIIITDAELAARWKIKKQTIAVRRMRNDLPKHFYVGRFPRYRLSDVIAYENEHYADH